MLPLDQIALELQRRGVHVPLVAAGPGGWGADKDNEQAERVGGLESGL